MCQLFFGSEIGKSGAWGLGGGGEQYQIQVMGECEVGDLPSKWGEFHFNPGGRHDLLARATHSKRLLQHVSPKCAWPKRSYDKIFM